MAAEIFHQDREELSLGILFDGIDNGCPKWYIVGQLVEKVQFLFIRTRVFCIGSLIIVGIGEFDNSRRRSVRVVIDLVYSVDFEGI